MRMKMTRVAMLNIANGTIHEIGDSDEFDWV